MTAKTSLDQVQPYITKDGSEIRELLHPGQHVVRQQSLAEARIPPGGGTLLHKHRISEEIYHISQGCGLMQLGNQRFAINRGDSIAIPPGTLHCVTNTGEEMLHILCCCAPAYTHQDTYIESA